MKSIGQTATDRFIEAYLSPELGWVKGTRLEFAFSAMESDLARSNPDIIAHAILDLSYDDFLNTPYWRAISWKVRRNARQQCAKCESTFQLHELHAHHPNYYIIHGYELQDWKKLICLCERCHALEHNRTPPPLRQSAHEALLGVLETLNDSIEHRRSMSTNG